jgi:RHS repeat-associated protein/fimbrial isopeptide formation D2 family protein
MSDLGERMRARLVAPVVVVAVLSSGAPAWAAPATVGAGTPPTSARAPKAMKRADNTALTTQAPGGKAAGRQPLSAPRTAEAHPTAVTREDKTSALAEAAALGEPVEVTDARTESTSTLANPDGTLTLQANAGPIRLRRGADWTDVDTTLQDLGGVVMPRAAKGNVRFSSGGNGELVSVGTGQRRFAVSWPHALPAPVLSGDTATYRDVRPGIDLVLRATRMGYAQTLVLRERPTSPVIFDLPLTTDGFTASVDAHDQLQLRDNRGVVLVQAATAEMWGSKIDPRSGDPADSKVVTTRLVRVHHQPVLRLQPDQSFLDDPTVSYPLTIDPSPSLTLQADTWVQTDYLNTSQYSSTILKSGTYDGGTTKARSFVRFDVSSILDKNVSAATLKLYNYYSYSCNSSAHKRTDIFPLTGPFGSSTVWSNQPPYLPTTTAYASFDYGYSSSCPANWGVFSNMAAIVTLWANRTQTNYGIVVKANSETDSLAWKKFYSQDNGSNIPYLQVTYTSDPTVSSPSPANNSLPSTVTPSLSAIVADADGGTVYESLDVQNNATGAAIYTNQLGSANTNGLVAARSSFTIGAGKLVYGTKYRWRVRAKDPQGNYSAYLPSATTWYYFTPTQTTQKPTAPFIDVAAGNASAQVTWTAPSDDGNSPITSYRLYAYLNTCPATPSSGTAFQYFSVSSSTFAQTVNGLSNGSTYCFAVTAVNAVGESVPDTAAGTPHGLAQVVKSVAGDGGVAQPMYAFGQVLTYAVTVTNPETAGTMTGLQLADAIPAALDVSGFHAWTSTTAAPTPAACAVTDCPLDDHTLTVKPFDLAAGKSQTLTYQVRIPASEALGCLGALVNTATVTNVAGPASAQSSVTACNGGLGTEPWWSYANVPVGPQTTGQVNVANGNLVLATTDATPVTGHGRLGLVLRRVYNSGETTLATLPGSLAAGWQFNVGQSDDLAGAGVGSGGLYVPTAESISAPGAVTLIDRDGTRHVFRPNTLGLDALSAAVPAAMRPTLLQLDGGYATLCADQSYTAPQGVHLGLWRYVETSAGACNALTDGNSRLLGFAAVRPDRIRYEWAATGQPLTMSDGAGNRIDYVYDNQPSGVPTGTFNGLSLNLGNLRAVYDPHACTATTSPVTLAGLPDRCRVLRFYYPSATELDVYDPATRPNLTIGRGPTRYYFDTPAAGQPKHLIEVINPSDSANNPTLTTLDPASTATRPDRIFYSYGSDCSGSGAGTHQLCAVSSQRNSGVKTLFGYGSSGSGLPGDPPRISQVTDRRGTLTTFAYTAASSGDGTATTVDTNPGQGAGTHRRVFDDIDSQGRVGTLTEGSAASSNNTLGITYYTWDGRPDGADGVHCQQPSTGLDNNLCLVQRIAGGSTPDEETNYNYNDEGGLLSTHRCVNTSVVSAHTASCPAAPSTAVVDDTSGYRTLIYTADSSTPLVIDDIVSGNGQVSTGSRPLTGDLFVLSDRTQSLSARGNDDANANSFSRFLTTYRVDDLATAVPGAFNASGSFCSGVGGATGNSGLLCSVDAPAPTAADASGMGTTRYSYDGFGQRLTMSMPNAVAAGSGANYSYAYFADQADTDLSGSVYTGGWLRAVTDPTGAFVAFGYDAAGNTVRTWDRDATQGHVTSEFTGAGYTGGGTAPTYAETTYGPVGGASGAIGLSAPWRYPLSTRDPLGNTSTSTVDQDGNVLVIRPARGTASGTSAYDITQTFDDGDLRMSVQLPEEATAGAKTTFGYDVFGNLQITTDPLGHVSATAYDAKNRATDSYVGRLANPISVPTGCERASNAPVVGFPASSPIVYCHSSVAYDMVDNPISTTDASAQTTAVAYDGLHRPTTTTTPRGDGTYGSLTAKTVYDRDGHVLVDCPPRQQTEGGANSCTSSGAFFSTHTSYDTAGRIATTVTHRVADGSQPLTTTFGYDADGNTVTVTDPRRVTTTAGFDLLDRRTEVTIPRAVDSDGNATLAYTTSTRYTAAGDVLAVFAPGSASDSSNVTGTSQTRVTGYGYDAAHHATDTVQALQLSGTDPANNMNPAALRSAIDSAPANATGNQRNRVVYDADGNVAINYDPRAFTGAGTLTSPDARYSTRIDYDHDGRPVLQLAPRYDTSSSADPTSDPTMSSQCPTGTVATSHGYPATTGVCQTSVVYDAAGRVSQLRLPTYTGGNTNRTVTFGYTDDNLRRTVTGPDPSSNGSQILLGTREFDGTGRPVKVIDALSRSTTIAWTGDGLQLQVTATPGPGRTDGPSQTIHQTSYAYDPNGNPLSVTQPRWVSGSYENDRTVASYTPDNLLAQVSGNGSGTFGTDFDVTSYTYDGAGNTIGVKSPSANAGDANNATAAPTLNVFSADKLLLSSTAPVSSDGSSRRRTSYSYDPAGRKTNVQDDLVDASGAVTANGLSAQEFGYTPLDQLATTQGRGNDGCIRNSYDPAGQPLAITNVRNGSCTSGGTATTVNLSYYLDGQLRTSSENGRDSAFGYDAAGQLTSRRDDTSVGAQTSTYTYNDAGLPSVLRNPLVSTPPTTRTYTRLGQPATQTDPNGQSVTWTFEADNTLSQLGITSPSGASNDTAKFNYTYDEQYRKLTQAWTGKSATTLHPTIPTVTYSYDYDPAGRLKAFTNSGLLPTKQTLAAAWDHDGNRLSFGDHSFTYRADDSIATGPSGPTGTSTAFTQDVQGRLVSDGCAVNGYDGLDRLTTVASSGTVGCPTNTVGYVYDGLDRQTQRTDSTSSTGSSSMFYSGVDDAAIAEQYSDHEVGYALDPSGTVLAGRRTGSTAGTNYLTEDGTGSIGTTTDSTGAVSCTARYNPFGEPAGNTAAPVTSSCNTGSADSSVFYRGNRKDGATGAYQLGARTYDPSKAAFLTADAYRDGGSDANLSVGTDPLTANRYSYVNGDPVNFTDPSGHMVAPDGGGACDSGCQRTVEAYKRLDRIQQDIAKANNRGWFHKHFHISASDVRDAAKVAAEGATNFTAGFVDETTDTVTFGHNGAVEVGQVFHGAGLDASYNIGRGTNIAVQVVTGAAGVKAGVLALRSLPTLAREAGGIANLARKGVQSARVVAAERGAKAVTTVKDGGQALKTRLAARGQAAVEHTRSLNAAAEAGGSGAARSTNFIVHPNGDVVPIPRGAVGPTPVDSGKGFQFTGGSGGHGLDPRTTDVRIMDPVTTGKYQYPNGYVSYSNGSGQAVNPYTGQTVGKADSWWHWPF